MGANGTASRRPARRPCAAAIPASAATCQCSMRICSSPPSCRHLQRARSPAATIPSAANNRSSQTTPFSSVSPEPWSQSTVGATPMPTTTTSAPTASPSSSSTTSPPGSPAARRTSATPTPVRRSTPWAPCNDPQYAPIRGPSRLAKGISITSTTVTWQPMPAQVDATSAPMNPAPMTTTRHDSTAVTAARRANESSSVRRVKSPSWLLSPSVPGSRRGEAPVASTRASPFSTVPSSISTSRAPTSSRTARWPSTSCTCSSPARLRSASTAFSGGQVPANTCLDRGGRS